MEAGLRLERRIRESASSLEITALAHVASALRLFGCEGIVVAFNGGKDATVVLHLFLAALARHCKDQKMEFTPRAMYLHDPHEFPEVEEFVGRGAHDYGLQLLRLDTGYVDGLEESMRRMPETKAFIIGTREGDPHADQLDGCFTPSTPPYPPFMRVCPILKWKYRDVWQFLRAYELPYCSLYDQGYTSLGNKLDTKPNPALQVAGKDGVFLPPWALIHGDQERDGRTQRSRSQSFEDEKHELKTETSRSELKSAALVVIGDEILRGAMQDENVLPAALAFHKAGIRLGIVSFLPDNVDQIAEEVKDLSSRFEVVVTSGGIGPTHDDVTLSAVAAAFGEPLIRNREYESFLLKECQEGDTCRDEYLRMADLPAISRLIFGDQSEGCSGTTTFPVIKTRNIYSLPGIPTYFRQGLALLERRLERDITFSSRKLYLSVPEVKIAGIAEYIANKYRPSLSIGCYPFVDRADCKAIVSIEGQSCLEVQTACDEFLGQLPAGFVSHHEQGMDLRSPVPRDHLVEHTTMHTSERDTLEHSDLAGSAVIRKARIDDVDTIASFNQKMAMETENMSLDGETVRQGVRSLVDDESKGWYWVVETSESTPRRIGCVMVTFEWSDWRNAMMWWIQSVFVVPQFRRLGLFRRMYNHIRDEAHRSGAGGIRLYTHRENQRAAKTYASLGMSSPYVVYEALFAR